MTDFRAILRVAITPDKPCASRRRPMAGLTYSPYVPALQPTRWAQLHRRSMARITMRKETMGLADKLKGLTKKAEDSAVEHKDQIHEAVQKAEVTADERTSGKYHEQIQNAGAKVDGFVDGLQEPEKVPASEGTTGAESPPRAS
jgi:hypothetical protein